MERLRQLREKRGITQTDVASFLSVGKNTISRYESGNRYPDNETLQQLADFFMVTTDYLLGRTNDPIPPSAKNAPPTFEAAMKEQGITKNLLIKVKPQVEENSG